MVEGGKDAVLCEHCEPVFVAGKSSQHSKVAKYHGIFKSLDGEERFAVIACLLNKLENAG